MKYVLRNSFGCLSIASIGALLTQQVFAAEGKMQMPPVEISASENILSDDEISDLKCTETARKVAADYEGIDMKSELVSHDEKLGYIFRYDIKYTMVDDGTFHPENNTKGKIYNTATKLVMQTKDGEFFRIATHPMFELPMLGK